MLMDNVQISEKFDYLPMKCIDCTFAMGKNRQLDETIQSSQCSQSEGVSEPSKVPMLSSDEDIDILCKNSS